jgi:hypothetical protein
MNPQCGIIYHKAVAVCNKNHKFKQVKRPLNLRDRLRLKEIRIKKISGNEHSPGPADTQTDELESWETRRLKAIEAESS